MSGLNINSIYKDILSKPTYHSNINFAVNKTITEYDIKSAYPNILYSMGLIDKVYYNLLISLDKKERVIDLSKFIKENNLYEEVRKGIQYYHEKFLSENFIPSSNILEIKNDAIILIDRIPKVTSFDNINYSLVDRYNCYYKYQNVSIYLYADQISGTYTVYGLGDYAIDLHDGYMIKLIINLLKLLKDSAIMGADYLNDLIKTYDNRELDINYYREFNAASKFRIVHSPFSEYLLDTMDANMVDIVDISYNHKLLMDLFNCIFEMYAEI